jgi:ribosomal protein S12 methylthiotransferase
MYTYPAKFPLDIIDSFNKCQKLCRYIDIPIQHCADNVLKSMRRGITQSATRELLMRLKNEIPNLALRTTLLVGYPNETEDDFKELCDFVEEMHFHRLGVFEYSQEEGTSAFVLGDPIQAEVKQERRARVMRLQKEISEQNNESLVGKTIKVLIDTKEGDFFIGRTEWDAPEIDQEVVVRSNQPLKSGTFKSVTVTDATEYDLFASI